MSGRTDLMFDHLTPRKDDAVGMAVVVVVVATAANGLIE